MNKQETKGYKKALIGEIIHALRTYRRILDATLSLHKPSQESIDIAKAMDLLEKYA